MRGRAAALAATLLLAGCAPPRSAPEPEREYFRVGPLEISAYVERDLADVLGSADVMNTGRDTVRLEYAGQCALAILLYDPEPGGAPRWDSSAWWAAQGECPGPRTTLDLPPRTLARIIAPLVEATSILGDSLGLSDYRTAFRLHLLAPTDTTLLLPAGELHFGPGGPPALAAGGARPY